MNGTEVKTEVMLVLAGSYRQFRCWLEENHFKLSDYHYIRDKWDLMGRRCKEVIRVGTWWEKFINTFVFRLIIKIS